jgi:hypothetical protein
MALGKSKESIWQLEQAMHVDPKLIKKFFELNPSLMQVTAVVDVIARFKRNKNI